MVKSINKSALNKTIIASAITFSDGAHLQNRNIFIAEINYQ